MEIILYPKYLIQRMFAHDRRGFFSAGYKLLYPECSRRGMTPWQHYVLEGKRKGFDDGNHPPEAFFFREGYELEYPDVKAAGVDPWRHYADKGASEGRDNGNHPQAGQFFAEGYLEMYPDMAKSGMDPWRHYVLKGRKEGRDNGLHPDDEEFFEEGYLEMYPDTAKSGMDPWHHYVLKGRKKGRDNGLHPDGKKFFAEGYLEMYPDAAKTGMDPWRHYVLKGKNAGLDNGHHPNPGQFFAEGYLGMYPDAAKSGMDPWHHYVLKGRKEGRDSGLHPDGKKFFAEGYLEMYPDAAKTGMDPWHHYVLKGCKEGRDNGHHPDKTMFFPEGYKCNYPCCTSEPYGSDLWMNYIKIGKAAKRNNGLLPAGPFFYAGYLERHPHGSIAEAWKDYVLNSLKAPDKDMYLYPDGNWVRASLWSIKPSVAVIMPVSNSRDTVMQAIRSVLDQSWPYWHLYAAADSSDDGILEFLKSAVSDPRIILLTSGREGVPSARSTAVRHMGNEDYVAYLDPGHTWNREYLELMLCRLLETHSCCCYCAMKKSVKSGGGTAMVQEFLYDPFDIHRLLESDYIDLNVLMHRAGVFEETGVFDPSLRGMVGWDFVLSLAQRYPFSALPYAGCSCEIEEVKEQTVQNGSFSQRCLNAVRGRHLPDWNFLAEKKGSRDDRLVSVIIYFSRNDSVTFLENCLKSLKNARAYGHSKYRTEIILVDDSCSERGHSAVLRFYKESLADYILSRTGCGFPLGCSMALSLAHGSFTVFLDSQAYVSADWLDHLIDPLKRHHALKGTTAKVLQPDGVINSAGCLFDTVSGLPYGALHELPAGSAAAGRITMMPSVSSSCSAFRTSDIIARKGLYCIYASGIAIPDLCLQLGGGRACFAFIPSSSVVCPADAHPLLPDDFEFFAERWSGHIIFGEQEYFARRKLCGSMKSGEAAYSVPFNKEPNTDRAGCPAGCSVPACDFSGTGCGIRLSSEQQSVIRRIKSFSKLIVIKDPAPGRPFYQKYEWGDYYYARSLARAFGRLGFDTRIDSREDWYTHDDGACINIVLRGCVRFYCGRYPKSLNVMWLISHPDMTDDRELNEYDFILAASEILTGKYRGSQSVRVPCAFLPQCTDPEIFSPAPPSEACSSGNLLLGNSRGVLRDTVKKCLDEGVSLEIIGNGWDKLVKPEFVRSGAVPSFLVPFFYRSAETVLNDHWEDMRQNGIVSNRIYDVLACGRGIVTDNYRSIPDELKFACFSYEDCGIRDAIEKCRQFNKSITDEQKLKLYGTISDRHSFSRRALQIIEALYPILKDGRWKNRQESVTSEK